MRRALFLALFVTSVIAVPNYWIQAGEIRGQVAEKTGDTVRITTTSDDKPRVGDKIEIFILLPNQGGTAVVATGRVQEIRADGVIAKIERATGTIKKSQFARILSSSTAKTVHPVKPKVIPDTPEPGLTPEPLDDPSPINPPDTPPVPLLRPGVAPAGDFATVVQRYRQAILQVGDRTKGGWGTAFVISRKHRILVTNAHVADNAVDAILNQSRTSYKIKKKWYHPGVLRKMDDGKTLIRSTDPADGEVEADCPDIAILQLDSVGPDLPAEVQLASPEILQALQGQQVGMMGYPGYQRDKITKPGFFASATFVDGTINRLTGFGHNSDAIPDQQRLVQYSAPNYPGFSGSPLFLKNGQVVVVNNHIHLSTSKNVKAQSAYGIRIDAVWELLQVADLAKLVAGVPTKVNRTTKFRPQTDDRVESLRSARQMSTEARELNRHGDFQAAIKKVGTAIDQVPEYWRPYWRRALIANHYVEHAKMSKTEKLKLRRGSLADHLRASTLYRQGHGTYNIRLQLDIAREQINVGRLTGQRSYNEAAFKVLNNQSLIDQAGKYKDYLLALRGSVLLDLNNLPAALKDLNLAILIAPDSADYYRTRASIWQRLGQTTEAARDRQRYQKLHQEWMKSHGHHAKPHQH